MIGQFNLDKWQKKKNNPEKKSKIFCFSSKLNQHGDSKYKDGTVQWDGEEGTKTYLFRWQQAMYKLTVNGTQPNESSLYFVKQIPK